MSITYNDKTDCLEQFFQTYQSYYPELENVTPYDQSDNNLLALYGRIFPLMEQQLWGADGSFAEKLRLYQGLFREQEALLNQLETDERYDFILSIPIADRPEHLRGCLESIYQLCKLYAYGSSRDGFFAKVTVVVVEDSKETQHIEKDIALAEEYQCKGLRVYHYGQQEQYELMLKIPEALRHKISSIIGEPSTVDFYHKGQAVTRNLSYLKALQLTAEQGEPAEQKMLYYFVDSDQQFRVNRNTSDGDEYVYALNYFYYINRVFCEKNISMLTGKLVCDPPVSPSVMSGNFLDDVIAFFQQLSDKKSLSECSFHPENKIKPDDAAYHDMAHLFGLGSEIKTYDYCCTLKTKHDHHACLQSFSQRINYFFFGEHLTRKTYFSYSAPQTDIVPARTIYPGNYIVNFDGLKYIIPFGQLRLRMSGPTAGRLIQMEIKEAFASINLPMLHARTLQSDFKDEYRPGVEDNQDNIDLSDEFERQFFGDLMLFTVVRLAKSDVVIEDCNTDILLETFAQVEDELLTLYENKHHNVLNKCDILQELINNKSQWWQQNKELLSSIEQVQQFIKSLRHNFSKHSTAYQQIQSKHNRQQRIETMIGSILNYRKDRDSWDKMLMEFHCY